MSEYIFRRLNEMEARREFNEIIQVSLRVLEDKDLLSFHKMIQTNIQRVIKKIHHQASDYWVDPMPIYQMDKNPYSYYLDIKHIEQESLPPLISLTTISGRLDRVYKTIQTIKNQTAVIHSINLYISDTPYLLDMGIDRNNEELRKIHELGVNIYLVPNIGPYRKQIPIVHQLKNNHAPLATPIITIDDDVIYPNNIIERLMGVKEHVVVAHRGRCMIIDNEKKAVGTYSSFVLPKQKRDYLNLGTGKNGILYRLGFFPDKIDGYVGPLIAPTADDLWCKWVTAFLCIPTEILEPEAAYNSRLDFEESNPEDKNGLFHVFNNKGSNDVAIANLENYYLCSFGQNLSTIYSFK